MDTSVVGATLVVIRIDEKHNLFTKILKPIPSQQNVGERFDCDLPRHSGLNATNRQPSEKRTRDSGCKRFKARRLSPRYPLFYDPFLIFGVNNRQFSIVAENFFALI